MKMIERATAHYKALIDEPQKIPVPEWNVEGEEPCIIYFTPLTLHDRKGVEHRSKGNKHELAADIIILKAKDKAGKHHFSREDKPELMRFTDCNVLERIAVAIAGLSDRELAEEAEKN